MWSIGGTGSPDLVAKFYHQGLTEEKSKKLEAMCRLKSDGLLRIAAWPTDLLRPSPGATAQGFVMPKIVGYEEAHLLYTPKSRRAHFPDAQFPFILHAAVNVARAFATVHDAGQVIGDVNHANLMISKDATVKLIDCDSFEISDGRLFFPCLVGVPTFTPPELQGKSFAGVRRTVQHDAFGLAVLLFHMLFLGRHPFSGIFRQGKGDKTIEDAIRELRFAYLPDSSLTEMDQPAWVPKLGSFPADVGALFTRAFGSEGVNGKRPTGHEWTRALEGLSRSLKRCATNAAHHFCHELGACPWCTAEKASGIPIFAATVTVIRGAQFDLVAIWAKIEAIKPDTSMTPQLGSAYAVQYVPDPAVPKLASQRRKMRMLAAGVILVAVAIVAPGTLPEFLSIGILIAALVGATRLWQSGRKIAEPITKTYENAVLAYEVAFARWQALQNPPPAFAEAKRLLQTQRNELDNLPVLKAARMRKLSSDLRNRQLARHLERHRIADATITGIGSGRKSLLIAWGIVDANDVHPSLAIKGIGPMLKANLLVWRKQVEQSFVFNPNEPPDPADVSVIEREIEQRKTELIQALLHGPTLLARVLQSWQTERFSAISHVDFCTNALSQAKANYGALGRF